MLAIPAIFRYIEPPAVGPQVKLSDFAPPGARMLASWTSSPSNNTPSAFEISDIDVTTALKVPTQITGVMLNALLLE